MPAQFDTLIVELISFIPRLVIALVVFFGSLVLAGAIKRWVYRMVGKRIGNVETQQLFARLARWGVIVGGTLVALDQVNFNITGFLTGLGIAGFTIGFALQDIARNFIAGILLLMQRPFHVQDFVESAGFTGKIIDVSTRDTVIETLDGDIVILPNTSVLSNPIINYSRQPKRRRTVTIGLGYGQDVEKAIKIFTEAIGAVEGVLAQPPPRVLARELGDWTLNLLAQFWLDQSTHNLFAVQSDVVIALNRAATREGIALPYPIQTVRTVRVENEG